uniref:Condensin complex subunit 2 n=1 Tax=Arion vulgaris TaxID=1028688 RepID=A0A0B6ZZN9_9EUPU
MLRFDINTSAGKLQDKMPQREILSPLTNTPFTPQRPHPAKYVSPSTSRSHGLASPTPNLANFPIQDEDLLRKERRRKSQVFDIQRRHISSPSSVSPSRSSEGLHGLTSAQLANHYVDCIKLSAENKINAKNAFGLHLIDYMTELVKKKELENFQVASSTLDASVKIYAGRVDFIHSHTYKVLSGLGGGKSSHEDVDTNEEAGESGEIDMKPKKRKKAGKANTVETNLKNINADKFDLEFEVDPMFQIMSAAFDEGGARGLLLNRLRCFDDTQQFVLDSSTTINVVEDTLLDSQISRKPTDISDSKELLTNFNLGDKQICPSLAEFCFTDWKGETSVVPKDFSDFAFDPTAEPQHLPTVEEEVENIAHDDINDVDLDDDQPETVGGTSDADAITGWDSQAAEFVESAFSDLTHGSVGKLRQILAMEPSDYSYFNKVLMRTWAGPTHWKIAPVSKMAANQDTENKTLKKKKKSVLKLTYETSESQLDKLFVLSKVTTVTKITWSRYTKKRTTMPEDQQLDSQDRLFCLFYRPHVMMKWRLGDSVSADDGIDNYNYNNKNDVENFCPVVRDEEDENDFFDLSNETNFQQLSQNSSSQQSGFLDSGLNGTIFTQDKLVAAPHKVERIDIKYAKTAKRVDVRKLKFTMWSLLTKDKSLAREDTHQPCHTEDISAKMTIPHNFRELENTLPSQVSANMAKNLTIQTVFACLLYITNEKILKLSSTEGMDDIYIEQDYGN